jgi:hypothetical protein
VRIFATLKNQLWSILVQALFDSNK